MHAKNPASSNAGPAADWRAAAYQRFEAERTRPAAELLARVPAGARRRIVDLGCGPGNSTALLAERHPKASIVGLDSSPDMLAAARARLRGQIAGLLGLPRWLRRRGEVIRRVNDAEIEAVLAQ